jgi:hypothetical protein
MTDEKEPEPIPPTDEPSGDDGENEGDKDTGSAGPGDPQ